MVEMKPVERVKAIEHNPRTDLYSDDLRLSCIIFDDCPEGIDFEDLWRATSLGAPIGATSPELEEKFGTHPLAPIERICGALKRHAVALSELKADGEGAPTRHKHAVPASTINFLAWEMLVRCNNSGLFPPTSLLELIRMQLDIRSPQKSREVDELVMKREDACRFSFNNPEASFRDIANRYGVNVSTVSRWDKEYNLRERGKMLQAMCDQIDRHNAAVNREIRKHMKLASDETQKIIDNEEK
jgi:hypothetical protein